MSKKKKNKPTSDKAAKQKNASSSSMSSTSTDTSEDLSESWTMVDAQHSGANGTTATPDAAQTQMTRRTGANLMQGLNKGVRETPKENNVTTQKNPASETGSSSEVKTNCSSGAKTSSSSEAKTSCSSEAKTSSSSETKTSSSSEADTTTQSSAPGLQNVAPRQIKVENVVTDATLSSDSVGGLLKPKPEPVDKSLSGGQGKMQEAVKDEANSEKTDAMKPTGPAKNSDPVVKIEPTQNDTEERRATRDAATGVVPVKQEEAELQGAGDSGTNGQVLMDCQEDEENKRGLKREDGDNIRDIKNKLDEQLAKQMNALCNIASPIPKNENFSGKSPAGGRDPTQTSLFGQNPADDSSEHEGPRTRSQTQNANKNSNPTGGAITQTQGEYKPLTYQTEQVLDYVKVTFHAIVGSEVRREIQENNASLVIVFGAPFSDWNTIMVKLKIQSNAYYAHKKNLGYLTGDLEFPTCFLAKDVPYKYILQTESHGNVWEKLQTPTYGDILNRLLNVQKNTNKYDEALRFSGRHNFVERDAATLSLLSTINADCINKYGLAMSLEIKDTIMNDHKGQGQLRYCYKEGGAEYRSYVSCRVMEVERQVFSTIQSAFETHLNQPELPRKIFSLVAYIFLFVESSEISFDSLRVLKNLFCTLAKIWPLVEKEEQITHALPDLALRIKLKKALVQAANKFFYLIDSTLKYTDSDKDDCSSWIIIFPYMWALDATKSTENELLAAIEIHKWKRFSDRLDLHILSYQSTNWKFQTTGSVQKALLSSASPAEVRELFAGQSFEWMLSLPFKSLVYKFFNTVTGSTVSIEDVLKPGSNQLLYRLQIYLADLSEESKEDPCTVADLKDVYFATKDCSADRMLLLADFLLQCLDTFLAADAAPVEDINHCARLLVNDSCSRLEKRARLVGHWNHWATLSKRANKFNLQQLVEASFQKRIQECDLNQCLDVYSAWTDEESQPLLNIVLNSAVEDLAREVSEGSSEGKWSGYVRSFLGTSKKQKAVELLSKFVKKTFKGKIDQDTITKMCHGSEMKIFLIMAEFKKEFSSEIKEYFKKVRDEVWDLTEHIRHGRCSVFQFQKFAGSDRNDAVWKNLKMLQMSLKDLTKTDFRTITSDMVNDFQKRVQDFTRASQVLEGLLPNIRDEHAHLIDEDQLPTIPELSKVKLLQLENGYSSMLQISPMELSILEWFAHCHKLSITFPALWMNAMFHDEYDRGSRDSAEENSDDEEGTGKFPDWPSYKHGLYAAKERIEEQLARLKDETITIGELEELLKEKEVPDAELKKELQFLGAPNLLSQAMFLRRFRTLKAAVNAFEGMLKVLKRSNFKQVDTIKAGFHDDSFQDKQINELSEDTMRQGRLFAAFKKEDVDLLDSFSKCGNIVHWLREHVKSNQELKVFLELASISAGESDIDLGRLMVFRAAVIGFAPLLFDINANSDLEKVMEAVYTVFKSREANPLLGRNIIEINRLLPWIKDIHERHGSVEANSLTTVEHINKSGIFTIRCKGHNGSRWTQPLEAITMNVHVAGERREMEHHELDELRSKLMLITVKEEGELDVDRYTQTLDSVEMIAKKLASLLDAGCHLFSELKLDGYLQVDKKVKLRVDFGHSGGVFNCNVKLEDALQQVIDFLHSVFDDWHRYIGELREEHNSLNYFATEQLVRLSSAFAELVHSRQRSAQLSLEAAMLVRSACPKLDLDDVKTKVVLAFSRAQKSALQDGNLDSSLVDSDVSMVASEDGGVDFTAHAQFRQLLDGTGVSHRVVLACLAHFHGKEASLEDMEGWCWDHEDESEEKLRAILEDVTQKLEVMEIQRREVVQAAPQMPAVTNRVKLDTTKHLDGSKNNLEQCLFQRWSSFQNRNNNDQKARDYIPFQVLALCLEELVNQYQSQPDRVFPQYLSQGSPNLMLCPQKDIHKAALMLFQADEQKPSPTLPEVLICTKATTKEQVELICRRAFKDETGKIFVVLHAHLLNFEISTHAENLFSRQTSPNYKIVFISSAEGSENSYINTAFEASTVTAPPPPQDSVLEAFLKAYQERKAVHIDKRNHPDPNGFSVRLVTSEEYGNGKTLFIQEAKGERIHLSLDEHQVEIADIINCWSKGWKWGGRKGFSLFHLDATLTSDNSRNDLLFSLSVLGGLADASGKLWVCSDTDVVMAELTSPKPKAKEHQLFYKLLPSINCKNPREVLNIMETYNTGGRAVTNAVLNVVDIGGTWVQLMNEKVFLSDVVQRPYQYLALADDPAKLDVFDFSDAKPLEYAADCLKRLLEACPVKTPSWTELLHFSSFLNVQLESTEKSVFCNAAIMGDSLRGFKSFVVQFLIQMAQDFATRSVRISDESHGEGFMMPKIEERRQWEQSPHPYIFFNSDNTLSFFGFFIDGNLNLVDEKTKQIIKPKFISGWLYQDLLAQRVVFNQEFVTQPRQGKLERLCTVMGVPVTDPDPSYELTYDNVMKMLAIIMRFRSNIPVVVMGETGSGKTTLVNFMCSLQRGGNNIQNMIIMKIHGGVTKKNIHAQVRKAMDIARNNVRIGVQQTVLFFDEANTTSAINTIKTVMCDRLVDGVPIPDSLGLQFVAAVNPYRKHSEDMIKKLEEAGLGYHIQADQTTDKLGSIPMRRLVYRVREIPQSMFPLIWDFGTLDSYTESLYIRQMVDKWLPRNGFATKDHLNVIEAALSTSQEYMRKQNDECSFVSLRDVDRTLKVLSWFQARSENILDRLDITMGKQKEMGETSDIIRNLVLALGVTYYVRLQDRMAFAQVIERCLREKRIIIPAKLFAELVEKCQDFFLHELQLDNNIAKNMALKENVWMMTLCIELQIPLFLVGKPGSSKSLAKTVVSDVMQGEQSYSPFYKNMKEIHMISFQCSPIATAGGILGTFKQSQKFQKDRDLSKFSAVVVLDEVGLAEDSEKMPLKALHPLLEDGCIDEEPKPHMKVSFIGISNWALDPAKMNRGIFVSRGVPTEEDLKLSADGICKNDSKAFKLMRSTIGKLTKGYFSLYQEQEREYFGLRDFYSLIKRIFNVAKTTKECPTDADIISAVQRNFGGFFGDFDPVEFFLQKIELAADQEQRIHPEELVYEAISGTGSEESRYILLLTKNNAALHILQEKEHLLDQRKAHVMFGSSFPQDKEYTNICYNINKVKIAMELGHTVILCNLNNLYESLYDALNQNYVMLGGKRYVDLGLGTHRVKCRVHEDFRLILVAEDEEVHKKFPIPLINRLEKHYLGMETILKPEMQLFVKNLQKWVESFCQLKTQGMMRQRVNFVPGDVFIGYHSDIIPSIVLRLQEEGVKSNEELEERVKKFLLSCAAPDAIMRLSETYLSKEEQMQISLTYYLEQKHASLASFLKHCPRENRLLQVTTSSRLLTSAGRLELEEHLELDPGSSTLLTLQQFDSRLIFEKRLKDSMTHEKQLLLIQSDVSSEESIKLIECARFVAQDMMKKHGEGKDFRVVFVIHVQRVTGGVFSGMSVHPWISFHIDELRGQRQHDIQIEQLSQEESLASALKKELVPLRELVIDAVPKAASCVQIDPSRVQRRIDVLLQVFKSEQSDLLEMVCAAVKVQLESSKLGNLQKWLLAIAMDSSHLKEGNTYQRSVWLHLQEQIVAPLRGCIEALDQDHGLELLLEKDMWIRNGVLQFFSSLHHEAVGAGSSIVGSFPFTKVILSELNELHKVANASGKQLQIALQSSRLAKPLLSCFLRRDPAVRRFLIDFIKLNFDMNQSSDRVQDILCQEIYNAAEYIRKERLEDSDFEHVSETEEVAEELKQWEILSPADIFFALKALKPRMTFLHNLLKFDPTLCDAAAEIDPAKRTSTFRTDVILFQTLLMTNAPKANMLNRAEHIQAWSQQVCRIGSLFQTLRSLDTRDDLLPELQTTFNQYEIVKLFLQHTTKSDFRPTEATLKRLVRQLEKNALKNPKDFDKLVKCLQFANKESIKAHFVGGENDGCVLCEEDFDRPGVEPVALPCGKRHVGCKSCFEMHFQNKEGEWACPVTGCGDEIEKTFNFESTLNCQKNVRSHQQFKKDLQFFFLDVLQRYVFTNEPPEAEVTEQLMSYVVTTRLEKKRTKAISPFDNHGIDAAPVIRSFLLQLLLQGENFESAKDALESFLKQRMELNLDDQQFQELCLLSVYCLEDRLLQDQTLTTSGRHTTLSMDCCLQLLRCQEREGDIDQGGELDLLLSVARMRLTLLAVAPVLGRLVTQAHAANKEQADILLRKVTDVICHHDEETQEHMKGFLVRILVRFFSRGLIKEWQQSGKFLELMPRMVRESTFTNSTDNFYISSNNYGNVRAQARAALMGNYNGLKEMLANRADVRTEWNLALCFLRRIEGIRTANVEEFIGEVTKLDPLLGQEAAKMLQMDDPLWTEFEHRSETQLSIVSFLHYFKTTVGRQRNGNYLQDALQNITGQKFFPTMEQDDSVEVIAAFRGRGDVTKLYRCPNCKTPFGVGNCGHPVADPGGRGRCPQCKTVVGGASYNNFLGTGQSSEQAGEASVTDATRTGHILGSVAGYAKAKPERELGELDVAVIQFMMHAAMATNFPHNQEGLLRCIHPLPAEPLPIFLMRHLENNLEQICQALGKSNDDVMVLMFHVARRLSVLNPREGNPQAGLGDKKRRQNWENAFVTLVIKPEIEALAGNVRALAARMVGERTAADEALAAILLPKEDEEDDIEEAGDHIQIAPFWFPRVQLNISSMEHTVGKENIKAKCPNLFRLLKGNEISSQVQHLAGLLRLQFILSKKFFKKIESPVVDDTTVERFLAEAKKLTDSERVAIESLAQTYFEVFNNLKQEVFNNGQMGNAAKEFLKGKDLSFESSAGVLFASEHPAGQCANALLDLLVLQHNRLLDTYAYDLNGELALPEALPCSEDISLNQLVTFEEKELNLMLVMHSEYTLEVGGRKTTWKLNVEDLERSVVERFFSGRAKFRIDSLPYFLFQNDDIVMEPLREKIPQEPLNLKLKGQMRKELDELRDVGNVLDHLQTTLAILQRTEDNRADDSLLAKMEQLHLLPEHGWRSLRGLKLAHAEACLAFLTLLRARKMLHNKHDPYNIISLDYHKPLPVNVGLNLKPLLDHPQLDHILFQLHRFIQARLKKTASARKDEDEVGMDPVNAPLQEYFMAFLDSIDEDSERAMLFDKKLQNGHAIAVFVNLLEKQMAM